MNPSKKSEKKQKKTQKSKTSDEVLKHVQEMSDIVLSPPKYADSRSKLKRKRESRQRKKNGCNGNCVVAFTPISLHRAKREDLRIEADIHCLDTRGTVLNLAESLANHYSQKNHPGTPKWSSKMVKDALSLFPKRGNKRGRKRKRQSQ